MEGIQRTPDRARRPQPSLGVQGAAGQSRWVSVVLQPCRVVAMARSPAPRPRDPSGGGGGWRESLPPPGLVSLYRLSSRTNPPNFRSPAPFKLQLTPGWSQDGKPRADYSDVPRSSSHRGPGGVALRSGLDCLSRRARRRSGAAERLRTLLQLPELQIPGCLSDSPPPSLAPSLPPSVGLLLLLLLLPGPCCCGWKRSEGVCREKSGHHTELGPNVGRGGRRGSSPSGEGGLGTRGRAA